MQSVTAYAGVSKAGNIVIGGALAVLAGGYHHNFAFDGPGEKRFLIVFETTFSIFRSIVYLA